ncbi:hypothetical protein [Calothrix sp. NIES-2098]
MIFCCGSFVIGILWHDLDIHRIKSRALASLLAGMY